MARELKGLEKIGGKSKRVGRRHVVKIFNDDAVVESDVTVGRVGNKKVLRIHTYDVTPASEQGRGHGSTVLRALSDWAKGRGVKRIIAEDVAATPAKFWAKNGHKPVAGENGRQDYQRDL